MLHSILYMNYIYMYIYIYPLYMHIICIHILYILCTYPFRGIYMGYNIYTCIGSLQDEPQTFQSSPSAAHCPRKHHVRPTCCEHTCCVPPCSWQARAQCAAHGYCTCGWHACISFRWRLHAMGIDLATSALIPTITRGPRH